MNFLYISVFASSVKYITTFLHRIKSQLEIYLPTDPPPAAGGIARDRIRGLAGGGHRRLRGPIRCPICKGPVPLPPGGLQHPEKPAGFPPGKAGAAAPGRDPGEGRGRLEEDVH